MVRILALPIELMIKNKFMPAMLSVFYVSISNVMGLVSV